MDQSYTFVEILQYSYLSFNLCEHKRRNIIMTQKKGSDLSWYLRKNHRPCLIFLLPTLTSCQIPKPYSFLRPELGMFRAGRRRMLQIIFMSSYLALVSWSPASTLSSSFHLTQRKKIAEIKQGNWNWVPPGYKKMYVVFASIFEGLKEETWKV